VNPNNVKVGDKVRILPGNCGASYTFIASKVLPGHFGETQVYGDDNTYGPVRATEIEVVK